MYIHMCDLPPAWVYSQQVYTCTQGCVRTRGMRKCRPEPRVVWYRPKRSITYAVVSGTILVIGVGAHKQAGTRVQAGGSHHPHD